MCKFKYESNGEEKLKKILLLLFILAIVIPIVANLYIAGSSGATVSLTRYYNVELQPGQTIIVNITVSDVVDMAGFRAHIAWDPNILKVTTGDPKGWRDPVTGIRYSIFEGPFLKSFTNATIFLVNKVNNEAGNITGIFNAITQQGVSATGSGVVAIINFTCVNPGSTTIKIVGPMDGHSSLPNSRSEQIPHKDIEGIVTSEPPPAIWTEFWFQASVGFGLLEAAILVLMFWVIVRWWRAQSQVETDELSELFSS
ncbi:MAG: cohesin domain-containing protein [Candidatus Bathyarchaeia archaeon]